MAADDFSFPTITNPAPHFAYSPSLWRISSEMIPDHYSNEHPEGAEGDGGACSTVKEGQHLQRKSFSCIESGTRMASTGDSSKGDEEKMDMLWEDLNDELQRISSMDRTKEKGLSRGGRSLEFTMDSPGEIVEFCCVKALKVSKTSSTVFSPRRSSILVLMKVLRKLFLLNNSHSSKKENYN